ncbi:NRDE family protein [Nocardia higoensis]|uniref:NRDE family protein n=1 Tax=Nocardia higoensis TaxID=228599 RepID=A0ABS0DE87_9NOCA|nr:NRDE family protein [Nocardia higoensis]MBF6356450.1 NRDE family protein [Nocardia higoensis]
MCLVLIGWRVHPEYRLVVAANRDEFYTRPAESARWWPEIPGLLAGRDVGALDRRPGDPPGTWLGLSGLGPRSRFAAVTNVRNPNNERTGARSRGALLMDFLRGAQDRNPAPNFPGPGRYLTEVAGAPDDYNGYNVLVSDLAELWWHSNRSTRRPRALAPGYHGLSNGSFVTSAAPEPGAAAAAPEPIWPKVGDGLAELRKVIESDPAAIERYFDVLADRTEAPDDLLPDTGVGYRMEKALSARFIANDHHGTRASTVLLVREDGGFEFAERSFATYGSPLGSVSHTGELILPE